MYEGGLIAGCSDQHFSKYYSEDVSICHTDIIEIVRPTLAFCHEWDSNCTSGICGRLITLILFSSVSMSRNKKHKPVVHVDEALRIMRIGFYDHKTKSR